MTVIPLSLYLDLEKDRAADLEVAAKTAIAWSKLIKDTAYIIDPAADVSTKLVGNADGSLSIDSLIEFIQKRTPTRPMNVAAAGVLMGSCFWLANTTLEYAYQKLLDKLNVDEAIIEVAEHFGLDIKDDVKSMSDEELQRLSKMIVDTIKKQKSNPAFQELFSQAEKDTAITGIGVSKEPSRRPAELVPRTRFGEYAGRPTEPEDADTRTRKPTLDLVLVSPRLLDDDRYWRFIGSEGEFGAPMADKQFRNDFIAGNLDIDLKKGIVIQAVVQIREEKIDGVWTIKDRTILDVVSYQNTPYQHSLELGQDDQGHSDDG